MTFVSIYQHERAQILARTDGGGLELVDDAASLQLSALLPPTTRADDALELVRSRVLRGLSPEFLVLEDEWRDDLRIIKKAKLLAVGLVDSSAYPGSIVEARQLEFIGRAGVEHFV